MLIRLGNVSIKIENSVPKKIKNKLIDELGNYIITNNNSVKPDICIYSDDKVKMGNSSKYRYYEIDKKYVKMLRCGPLLFTTNFNDKKEPVKINTIKEKDIRAIWYIIENIIKIVAFYRYNTIFVHGAGFFINDIPVCIIGAQRSGKTKILFHAAKKGSDVINEDFVIIDKKNVYPYFPQKVELAKHHFKQLERKDFLINYVKTKLHGDFSGVKTILVNIISKYVRINFEKIFSKDIIYGDAIERKKVKFIILNPTYPSSGALQDEIKKEEFISKSFEISYIEMSSFINILTYISLTREDISLYNFLNDYHALFSEIFSDVISFKQLTYNPKTDLHESLSLLAS